MSDTTFELVRGAELVSTEPELQKRINEAVRGLERKKAVEKALEMLNAAGQKASYGFPSEENPNKCFILLSK